MCGIGKNQLQQKIEFCQRFVGYQRRWQDWLIILCTPQCRFYRNPSYRSIALSYCDVIELLVF